MLNFKKFPFKSFAKICVALLIYGGGVACAIYSQLLANEDMATYSKDIDYQYERMLEYDVKPYSGRTIGKLGGDYFASINYGKLSQHELERLIIQLHEDGFLDYVDKYNQGGHFYKDNVVVIIIINPDRNVEVLITRYEQGM